MNYYRFGVCGVSTTLGAGEPFSVSIKLNLMGSPPSNKKDMDLINEALSKITFTQLVLRPEGLIRYDAKDILEKKGQTIWMF